MKSFNPEYYRFQQDYAVINEDSLMKLKEEYQTWYGTLMSLNSFSEPLPIVDVSHYGTSPDGDLLGQIFRYHGSDKSTKHNFHLIYAHLLRGRRNEPLKILEIGLGTNNLSFKSNMGVDGTPCASVRAFRDWAPNAQVYGADVDPGILVQEERIKTYFVDQTDRASLQNLAHIVGGDFDLIIDDGLHNPIANFNTVKELLPLLKDDGHLVVEDIYEEYLSAWNVFAAFQKGTLVKCKCESIYAYILKKETKL